ncbi:NAD-binding protein [Herbivorax sp. ANBcel31]|uniref:potassium channel family protein n=1 Tax=Herbivorax sp. ANBcel31 TaxID=3069754 RepID=UPI0027B2CBAC|nr:NAD-binding protein [Herbivorax sp. ANBcel31]MDQ2085713.1 NAD-binding protein [Herbivorax sp. ANBcel31]
MYIVIAGGGKLGYYLVKTLLPYKHKIVIIEPLEDMCRKVANDLHIPVINGDGTDLNVLSEIEAKNCDIFIAVTGKDEDNLIACQLAKRNFGVNRTIARVNNPKNIEVFQKLGVDIAVSSTSIIADLIEQEVDYSGIKTLLRLKSGKLVLNEIVITHESPVCNRTLKDINIPKDCVLISVIRNEEVIIPNGFTVLKEGDYIIAVSSSKDQMELKDYFVGKRNKI